MPEAFEPGDTLDPHPCLVLLAEDNPINQKLAVHLLRQLGCEVDLATNGIETLQHWSERPYDVIFMDCQMPHLDGYETTARIRAAGQRGRDIPIIAITANSMVGDRERCVAAGMTDYVSKPLHLSDLKRVLEAARRQNPDRSTSRSSVLDELAQPSKSVVPLLRN